MTVWQKAQSAQMMMPCILQEVGRIPLNLTDYTCLNEFDMTYKNKIDLGAQIHRTGKLKYG